MQPRTPRALLVDALGTLVDLEPPAPLLRQELMARFGIDVGVAEAGAALRAEIAYYRAHLQEGRDAVALASLRRRCAEVLRGALPVGERLAAVSPGALTEALLASLRFRAFADAPGALAVARSRGARVIVVSNWDVSLPEVLARVGLAPLLDGVLTSAGTGSRKPDGAIFTAALSLAGAAPEQALHIGDSFDEDIVGARDAGIEAILVRRRRGASPAGVQTISSLVELESVA